MKPLHLAAIFATFLVAVTGINSLRAPPGPDAPAKKNPVSKTTQVRCTIKRAVFGGTESALLRVTQGRVVHYVVLDLPTGNPRMPDYQSGWLEATYGQVEPTVVGVFPTVEAAVTKAASLCTRN